MYLDLPLDNLRGEALLDPLVSLVQVPLPVGSHAPEQRPRVPLHVLPGINQVQPPGGDEVEYPPRELAFVHPYLCAHGLLRHSAQQVITDRVLGCFAPTSTVCCTHRSGVCYCEKPSGWLPNLLCWSLP